MNEHMQRYNNVDEKCPVEKKMNLQTISTDLAKAFNGPKRSPSESSVRCTV